MPTSPRPSVVRRGMTLMEICLVLALLVLMAAITFPSLNKAFAGERLRKGADLIRTEWTKARIRAMTTGVPQVFRYQSETAVFKVEPWAGLDSELEASTSNAFGLPAQTNQSGLLIAQGEGALPEGVLFQFSTTANDSRNGFIAPTQVTAQGLNQTAWSEPIFFYPDGTSSTSRLLLRNDAPLFVLLELRGLTGVVTVSDLLSENEVPQ